MKTLTHKRTRCIDCMHEIPCDIPVQDNPAAMEDTFEPEYDEKAWFDDGKRLICPGCYADRVVQYVISIMEGRAAK